MKQNIALAAALSAAAALFLAAGFAAAGVDMGPLPRWAAAIPGGILGGLCAFGVACQLHTILLLVRPDLEGVIRARARYEGWTWKAVAAVAAVAVGLGALVTGALVWAFAGWPPIWAALAAGAALPVAAAAAAAAYGWSRRR